MRPSARPIYQTNYHLSFLLLLGCLTWQLSQMECRGTHWCEGCTAEDSFAHHFWLCPDPSLDWVCEESEGCCTNSPDSSGGSSG